jgi:hypothetical protein
MARVVSHAVKQASLNLRDMIDKKPIGIEIEDLNEIATLGQKKIWDRDTTKPEILETTIEQIRGLFNIGTEVKDWTVSYFPPPEYDISKKAYKESQTKVASADKGLGARFIVMIGSRDLINLAVTMGSTNAESAYLVFPGDCIQLKITICPVMDVYFNNTNSEKMAARKGFRETLIKKTLNSRHVLVFDAHVETSAVIEKVKNEVMEKLK